MRVEQRGRKTIRPSETQYRGRTPTRQRITIALDYQGLYGPGVDASLGVKEPAVDQWESGELVPTFAQVEQLAAITGFPVAFFYQPEPAELGVMFMCGEGGCRMVAGDGDSAAGGCPECGKPVGDHDGKRAVSCLTAITLRADPS